MGFGEALSRRQLLRLGLISGAAVAAPGLLAGCNRDKNQLLAAVEGQFPQAWSQQLPAGWQASWLGDPEAVARSKAALWALSDGWASALPRQHLQPIGVEAELRRLAPWAGPVSRLFAPEGSPALAFPWAFSPWVLVLRNRPDLAQRRAEGWELLLDPSLKGQLVLPSSPRVAMALLGKGLEPLMALRRQALAYDERDGLNLLLSGEAQALVTPLQRVIPLLRRDQRLQVVLPATGAPLTWQLLLQPAPGVSGSVAGSSAGSGAPLPAAWIQKLWDRSLLEGLLLKGWVPPLPRAVIEPVLRGFPEPVAQLLLPSDGVVERCWSLPPLAPEARLALQTLWDAAAP
jgi:hypothetical protein